MTCETNFDEKRVQMKREYSRLLLLISATEKRLEKYKQCAEKLRNKAFAENIDLFD